MKNKFKYASWFLKAVPACVVLAGEYQASAAINLGGAQNYAVFQTGADNENFNTSDAFVSGDVGIASAPGVSLGNLAVNGNVYSAYAQNIYNLSSVKNWIDAPLGQNPTRLSTYTGTINYGYAALAGVAAAIETAENTIAAYSPDYTLANSGSDYKLNNSSQTIFINTLIAHPHMAGVYVININGQLNLNGGTLTLDGSGIPAEANVVLNVTGQFSLNGNSAIKLAGGLTASQVLINDTSTQGGSITGGSMMYGTFLGDDLNAMFNNNASAVYGSVIAGSIQFASDMRIYGTGNEFVAFTSVPEPEGFALAAGLMGLLLSATSFCPPTKRQKHQPARESAINTRFRNGKEIMTGDIIITDSEICTRDGLPPAKKISIAVCYTAAG